MTKLFPSSIFFLDTSIIPKKFLATMELQTLSVNLKYRHSRAINTLAMNKFLEIYENWAKEFRKVEELILRT